MTIYSISRKIFKIVFQNIDRRDKKAKDENNEAICILKLTYALKCRAKARQK